ncbi:MAG: metal-dependent hydrolase [Ruminococcaceae bacterium]|nr:metal-dependent hydrolase [Oscillospiraceae bacterium]
MIIDFHTHTFPDKIADAALSKLRAASHTLSFTDGTVTGLKRSMKEASIDWSVVLPVATNPLKVESINDLSAALTERDGLVYFGCIHPDMENPKEEIARIARMGLKGIKIHPVYQGVDIDDLRFLRILDAAAEHNLIVVTHNGDDIGFPGVVHCTPQMTRNALKQVGSVKLVLAHMGGWKNWESVADALLDTSVYLDTAFSLGALVQSEPRHYSPEEERLLSEEDFCALVRAFGAQRILFGTDSPWSDQKREVEAISALPLAADEKKAIFFENAQRLLWKN